MLERQIHHWIQSVSRCVIPLSFVLLAACAEPYVHPSSMNDTSPRLLDSYARMEDGYLLPLTRWDAAAEPSAIVLALHGLNDYSDAFDGVGEYLSERGITVVAYDQRGFGNSAGRGLWHGSERLSIDLVTTIQLLRERYTDVPLYLLGESMGGAVVLTALASTALDIDGTVLVAPAVWTRSSMPAYQRFALWLAAHTIPDKQLTGEGLDLKPSDNIEMLRALGRDELVIKATRVDVLFGITNLMDDAMTASADVPGNILFLYGKRDDIIPAPPICELFERLSAGAASQLTAVTYEQGYHMLTRDLQAEIVLADIAGWISTDGNSRQTNGDDMRVYCAEHDEGE